MAKVDVIGPKGQFYEVLGVLHRLGCLHIEDISKKLTKDKLFFIRQMNLDKTSNAKKQELQDILIDVNGILSTFRTREENQAESRKIKSLVDNLWLMDEVQFREMLNETILELKERSRELIATRAELQRELINLTRYEAVVSKIIPLAGQMVALEGFDSIALLLEKKFSGLIEAMRAELSKITKDQFHLMAAEADETSLAILIIFSKNYARQVRSFVLNENVNEVRLPEELSQLSYDKALARINARKADIPNELNQIETELKQLSDGWYLDLMAKKQVLSDRLSEIQLVPEFGQTDYTFIIEGWLPKKNLAETKKALRDNFGNKTVMQIIKLTEEESEEAPIQYTHSRLVKPFEPIAQLFGNPRYGQVDPSPFLALFFPLFFGIILGDMGYGLIVTFIGWLLRRKYKGNNMLQGLGLILIMAGISSFLFGFIYGEFFGDLPERLDIIRHVKVLGITFPWERSKSEYLLPTLMFAMALGVAHIFLGLVLGAINATRAGAKKHVIEKVGMLGALISLFVIIAASSAYLPKVLVSGGVGVLIVFIAMLIYSAGIMGPIEVLGTLGNIVSYARIMAIGLVSVILASLANQFGGMMGNIFLGILVATMIHALNIAIHVFTPSLHVLRLNFVEFYGKFYESGGRIYNPFKRGGGL